MFNHGNGQINFARLQKSFGFGACCFMESEPEGWKMFSDAPQNFRKVIVQDDGGRGHPQLMSGAAANCLANMIYLVEEGPDEFVQLHARGQESERRRLNNLVPRDSSRRAIWPL